MADWKDRLGGAAGAATSTLVQVLSGTSVTAVPSNGRRIAAHIYVAGATQVHLEYGAIATSTLSQPIGSAAAPYLESDYLGPINAAVPSGASSSLRVREVGF